MVGALKPHTWKYLAARPEFQSPISNYHFPIGNTIHGLHCGKKGDGNCFAIKFHTQAEATDAAFEIAEGLIA
jgi:hypothetical protein